MTLMAETAGAGCRGEGLLRSTSEGCVDDAGSRSSRSGGRAMSMSSQLFVGDTEAAEARRDMRNDVSCSPCRCVASS